MILLIAGHYSMIIVFYIVTIDADYSAIYNQYHEMAARTWFVSRLVDCYARQEVNACVKLPSANPVASFPTRGDMTGSGPISRSSDASCSIISFICTAPIAVWSAGIVVRTTIHGIAKPVPCQHLCRVICGWIRASVFWVSTTLACIPLFEIRVLAGTAHPISPWPAHDDFSVFIKHRIKQLGYIITRSNTRNNFFFFMKDSLYTNVILHSFYAHVPELCAYIRTPLSTSLILHVFVKLIVNFNCN